MGCTLESGAVDLDASPDAARDSGPAEYNGQQFVEVEAGSFSTTELDFVAVPGATMELDARPGSVWLLLVSASLQSDVVSNDPMLARFLVDNVERGYGAGHVDGGALPVPWFGADVIDASEAHTVSIEMRANIAASTAEIAETRLVAIPLPAAVVVADAPASREITTRTDLATIDLNLLAGGNDALVIGALNGNEAPGGSSILTHLLTPEDLDWPTPVLSNNRQNPMPFVMMRLVRGGTGTVSCRPSPAACRLRSTPA